MPEQQPDHYLVLEVTRTATEIEIRTAYRRLAREHHPDANPGPEAEIRMRQINEAWEILRDPARRSLYDRQQPLAVRRPAARPMRRQAPAPRATRRERTQADQANWFAEDAPRTESTSSTEFTGDAGIDHYAAIGVRPDATRSEVLKALAKLAASLNGADISATEFSRRRKAMRDAWSIIGDQYQRAAYDRARKAAATDQKLHGDMGQTEQPQASPAEAPGPARWAHEARTASANQNPQFENQNPADSIRNPKPEIQNPPAGYRLGPITINGVTIDKGWDLQGADLRGADLRGLDLAGIDLRQAKLQGADLEAASLRKATLAGADLTGANLRFADLSNADCSGAWLRQSDLGSAALHATNLFRANLTGASLANAIGPGVNLDYADLSRADLTGARVTIQLIERATLAGTVMPDGSIRG